MKRITVLMAGDHTTVREGFRKMLELEEDLNVVGEAQDGRQAVALVKKLRPEVVFMDIAMPLLNGLEATRQMLKAVPATKVLCSPRIMTTLTPKPRRVGSGEISAQTNLRPRRRPDDSGSPKGKNIFQSFHFQASRSAQSDVAWSRGSVP